MNPLNFTFSFNPYSYFYVATLGILLLSSLFVLLNYLLFGRSQNMLYAFLMLLTTEVYIAIFIAVINAPDDHWTFRFTQFLYFFFLVLYNISIYAIEFIAKRSMNAFKSISLLGMIVLSILLFTSDRWIITRSITLAAYNKAGKGPLFFLLTVYVLILTAYVLFDLGRVYISDRQRFFIVWPIYTGIACFSSYMMWASIIIINQPNATPHIFYPALLYDFLVIVYVFRQIRANINEHNRLYQKYLTDALTGVYTRDAIFQVLLNILKLRVPEKTYVAVIDLDGFKRINDTYGHALGDQVLMTFGKLLLDFSSNDYTVGRLGGDEFMLIIQNCSISKIEMELKSLIIRYTVTLTKDNIDVLQCKAGLSIGVSPVDGNLSLEDNLYLADQSMYQAKKSGKNNVVIEGLND